MPAPAKTAPPNVKPGSSVNNPTAPCPYAPPKPCDVDKLVMEVTAYDDPSAEGEVKKGSGPGVKKKLKLKLETTTNRIYRKPPTDPKGQKLYQALMRRGRGGVFLVGPDHPARLLQSYDLLIDAIADFPTIGKAGPGTAQWKRAFLETIKPDPKDQVTVDAVRAYFTSTPTCKDQKHPILRIHPLDTLPDLPKTLVLQKPGANQVVGTNLALTATPMPFHDLPTSGFVFFELVKSLLSCTQPREVDFIAESCGARAPADGKQNANKELKGKLRIYRRDKWTVGVKIPPFGKFQDKREAGNRSDLFGASTGDRTRQQNLSVGGGLVQRNTTDNVAGNHSSVTDERWLAHKGWSTEEGKLGNNQYRATRFSDSDGTLLDNSGSHSLSQMGMRLSRSSGFALVVAHNDRELDIKEFIEKLKKGLEAFAAVVTDFQKLFKLVPKVGWTFDFTISVFEGWIGLEWAPSYVDDGAPIYDDRYCAVEYKWKGKIELTIIDLSVSVGFGIDVQMAGLAELTAKIEGSLTFKAKVAHDIHMDLFKGKERFEVETSGGPALTAKIAVNVLGYTLVGGQVSVKSGLKLAGAVEIEWSTRTFDLKGELKRQPVTLTGAIQYPTWYGGTKTRKIDPPIEIIGGGTIHTFR
jgi:hypothetical protein